MYSGEDVAFKQGVARSDTAASGRDDVWIPTTCSLCYGTCAILAHRVDGVLVKIEGNPESAVAKGKGVFFNDLLEIDWEHCSPVNLNLDLCARVKISPA